MAIRLGIRMFFFCLALVIGLSSASFAATITGTVMYNGEEVNVYVGDIPAQFWIRNEDTGQAVTFTSDYDPVSSTYHIYDLPPARYGIQTFIPAVIPNGYYPGNYYGWLSPITVSSESELVYQNLSANKLIHLLSPVDNNTLQQYPIPSDTYSVGSILFQWAPIAEAEYYELYIDEFQTSPFAFIGSTQHFFTTQTSESVALAPNQENRHYQFNLFAYNSDNARVGQIMIIYTGGAIGWDYRFIVARNTPESISQYILTLDNSVFIKRADTRKESLVKKLGEAQMLIEQGFYQKALKKLEKDIRPKFDGCYDENPKNDWIIDCSTQEQLLSMLDDLIAYVQDLAE